MTRLWWVRHGPTHEKAFVGWRDVPADLSDKALIDRVAGYLPADAAIVSSDLSRAVTTADAIGKNRKRLPHHAGLREFNFGLWDGLRFDEVTARDPDLSRRFWEEPGDLAPPDGESWNAVARRVNDAVDDLIRACPDQHLILVAHIGVIMTQIQRAAGCSAYEAMGHHIDNLSVTDMQISDGSWQIGRINHIA
ncbi:histidine phosphatase family protein [Cognatiyoonia sp. IB215182]|uniref:histidine phosphatase family protein n=1 Tax=Cognatiyoonia sp. IB215182 TaxID=3097353 RepID=UPI002A149AE5|nr:histidine phosphatase family protein [Cognatiyoonia sp. IB215182]MDX8351719.1 histidine phosphatase family protein [Cognatiyoonia sp. IB215182]